MTKLKTPLKTSALRAGLATITLMGLTTQAADPFSEFIRQSEPLTAEQEKEQLRVPPGFEVQLVASEPEIGKPMNMAFDSRGRLWVAQSREYPYAAPLDKPARDTIKILGDFDERGRARKISTFAEGLNIPIGLYPYKNGVIAFSIPNISFHQDNNGDGRADKSELVLGRFGFDRDTHGLTSSFRRGYDGWIYADHGYNNNTTLTAKDGSSIQMNSGNTYRFRPDGSRVEQFTWGQVNPFGLMFDPLGDLWSADCHSSPVYQLLRGAYYPSFGKPHDGLGFAPDICRHAHGSTAIAGIVHYAADHFPAEYRGNTFVGNVMSCRINRDSYIEQGSTRIAKEQPDLLISQDPWFRPVDLQLGPDGALYVADFYNKIIGHYEVPLDHPGRDRERGRIWRIIYRGTNAAQKPRSLANFDVSRSATKELIAELASPNLTRRMLAMNEMVDRLGQSAVDPVKKMMEGRKTTPMQKIHGLWVLHRLGSLDDPTLTTSARDEDRDLRVHAMRVLAETAEWNPQHRGVALAGLRDVDAYVQRAAADAVGQHPNFAHIRPLLDLRRTVNPSDSQLMHVARMALRNQLAVEGNLSRLQNGSLNEIDAMIVADAAAAIKLAEAASFLMQHVRRISGPNEKLADYLRHIARYAPENQIGELAEFTRTHFAEDIDFQLALFKSVEQGTAQRGAPIAPAVRSWGSELAERLFASIDPAALEWRNVPVREGETPNPWFLEKRLSADGNTNAQFVCSLSPGGEQLTGLLRSKPFILPAKLSFFIAGHDGSPERPPAKKNLIRLREVTSEKILAQSPPPRNDVAQPITWDLSSAMGKEGYLEIVDRHNGHAYAWLAVGRFDPPVVGMPGIIPNQVDRRQVAAAELAGSLRLNQFESKLGEFLKDRQADPETRAAAAKALAGLALDHHLSALNNILLDVDESTKLREKVAEILGELKSPPAIASLVQALQVAAYSLQKHIGLALASNLEGAEALLAAVADGKTSARLLQEKAIKDRLAAAQPPGLPKRLEQLTAHLSPASETRQKVIEQRRAGFVEGQASAALGAPLFKQHCAVCHAVDGQGALIGPQLDGVGGRGVERLLEDILDPNRNVDRAFRTSLLILKDGDVQSGLFRREEGEMLVLAESTGKEISVAKKDVQERRESETSLMPDNVSELMSAEDFNHLLAFLLSKGKP